MDIFYLILIACAFIVFFVGVATDSIGKMSITVLCLAPILIVLYFVFDYRYDEAIAKGEEEGFYETKEEAELADELYISSSDYKIKINKVNGTREYQLLTVDADNRYKIALETNDGGITWIDVNQKHYHIKVTDDPNLDKTIVRMNNKVESKDVRGKTYYKAVEQVYYIYFHPDSIQGGSTKRSCGENCTKEVETDIVR